MVPPISMLPVRKKPMGIPRPINSTAIRSTIQTTTTTHISPPPPLPSSPAPITELSTLGFNALLWNRRAGDEEMEDLNDCWLNDQEVPSFFHQQDQSTWTIPAITPRKGNKGKCRQITEEDEEEEEEVYDNEFDRNNPEDTMRDETIRDSAPFADISHQQSTSRLPFSPDSPSFAQESPRDREHQHSMFLFEEEAPSMNEWTRRTSQGYDSFERSRRDEAIEEREQSREEEGDEDRTVEGIQDEEEMRATIELEAEPTAASGENLLQEAVEEVGSDEEESDGEPKDILSIDEELRRSPSVEAVQVVEPEEMSIQIEQECSRRFEDESQPLSRGDAELNESMGEGEVEDNEGGGEMGQVSDVDQEEGRESSTFERFPSTKPDSPRIDVDELKKRQALQDRQAYFLAGLETGLNPTTRSNRRSTLAPLPHRTESTFHPRRSLAFHPHYEERFMMEQAEEVEIEVNDERREKEEAGRTDSHSPSPEPVQPRSPRSSSPGSHTSLQRRTRSPSPVPIPVEETNSQSETLPLPLPLPSDSAAPPSFSSTSLARSSRKRHANNLSSSLNHPRPASIIEESFRERKHLRKSVDSRNGRWTMSTMETFTSSDIRTVDEMMVDDAENQAKSSEIFEVERRSASPRRRTPRHSSLRLLSPTEEQRQVPFEEERLRSSPSSQVEGSISRQDVYIEAENIEVEETDKLDGVTSSRRNSHFDTQSIPPFTSHEPHLVESHLLSIDNATQIMSPAQDFRPSEFDESLNQGRSQQSLSNSLSSVIDRSASTTTPRQSLDCEMSLEQSSRRDNHTSHSESPERNDSREDVHADMSILPEMGAPLFFSSSNVDIGHSTPMRTLSNKKDYFGATSSGFLRGCTWKEVEAARQEVERNEEVRLEGERRGSLDIETILEVTEEEEEFERSIMQDFKELLVQELTKAEEEAVRQELSAQEEEESRPVEEEETVDNEEEELPATELEGDTIRTAHLTQSSARQEAEEESIVATGEVQQATNDARSPSPAQASPQHRPAPPPVPSPAPTPIYQPARPSTAETLAKFDAESRVTSKRTVRVSLAAPPSPPRPANPNKRQRASVATFQLTAGLTPANNANIHRQVTVSLAPPDPPSARDVDGIDRRTSSKRSISDVEDVIEEAGSSQEESREPTVESVDNRTRLNEVSSNLMTSAADAPVSRRLDGDAPLEERPLNIVAVEQSQPPTPKVPVPLAQILVASTPRLVPAEAPPGEALAPEPPTTLAESQTTTTAVMTSTTISPPLPPAPTANPKLTLPTTFSFAASSMSREEERQKRKEERQRREKRVEEALREKKERNANGRGGTKKAPAARTTVNKVISAPAKTEVRRNERVVDRKTDSDDVRQNKRVKLTDSTRPTAAPARIRPNASSRTAAGRPIVPKNVQPSATARPTQTSASLEQLVDPPAKAQEVVDLTTPHLLAPLCPSPIVQDASFASSASTSSSNLRLTKEMLEVNRVAAGPRIDLKRRISTFLEGIVHEEEETNGTIEGGRDGQQARDELEVAHSDPPQDLQGEEEHIVEAETPPIARDALAPSVAESMSTKQEKRPPPRAPLANRDTNRLTSTAARPLAPVPKRSTLVKTAATKPAATASKPFTFAAPRPPRVRTTTTNLNATTSTKPAGGMARKRIERPGSPLFAERLSLWKARESEASFSTTTTNSVTSSKRPFVKVATKPIPFRSNRIVREKKEKVVAPPPPPPRAAPPTKRPRLDSSTTTLAPKSSVTASAAPPPAPRAPPPPPSRPSSTVPPQQQSKPLPLASSSSLKPSTTTYRPALASKSINTNSHLNLNPSSSVEPKKRKPIITTTTSSSSSSVAAALEKRMKEKTEWSERQKKREEEVKRKKEEERKLEADQERKKLELLRASLTRDPGPQRKRARV